MIAATAKKEIPEELPKESALSLALGMQNPLSRIPLVVDPGIKTAITGLLGSNSKATVFSSNTVSKKKAIQSSDSTNIVVEHTTVKSRQRIGQAGMYGDRVYIQGDEPRKPNRGQLKAWDKDAFNRSELDAELAFEALRNVERITEDEDQDRQDLQYFTVSYKPEKKGGVQRVDVLRPVALQNTLEQMSPMPKARPLVSDNGKYKGVWVLSKSKVAIGNSDLFSLGFKREFVYVPETFGTNARMLSLNQTEHSKRSLYGTQDIVSPVTPELDLTPFECFDNRDDFWHSDEGEQLSHHYHQKFSSVNDGTWDTVDLPVYLLFRNDRHTRGFMRAEQSRLSRKRWSLYRKVVSSRHQPNYAYQVYQQNAVRYGNYRPLGIDRRPMSDSDMFKCSALAGLSFMDANLKKHVESVLDKIPWSKDVPPWEPDVLESGTPIEDVKGNKDIRRGATIQHEMRLNKPKGIVHPKPRTEWASFKLETLNNLRDKYRDPFLYLRHKVRKKVARLEYLKDKMFRQSMLPPDNSSYAHMTDRVKQHLYNKFVVEEAKRSRYMYWSRENKAMSQWFSETDRTPVRANDPIGETVRLIEWLEAAEERNPSVVSDYRLEQEMYADKKAMDRMDYVNWWHVQCGDYVDNYVGCIDQRKAMLPVGEPYNPDYPGCPPTGLALDTVAMLDDLSRKQGKHRQEDPEFLIEDDKVIPLAAGEGQENPGGVMLLPRPRKEEQQRSFPSLSFSMVIDDFTRGCYNPLTEGHVLLA